MASKQLAMVALEDSRGQLRKTALKCLCTIASQEVLDEALFSVLQQILERKDKMEIILAIRIINQAILKHRKFFYFITLNVSKISKKM